MIDEPSFSDAAELPWLASIDLVKCGYFVQACEAYFTHFHNCTPKQKVARMIWRLTGLAQEWASPIWLSRSRVTTDYIEFVQQFKAVFDHPYVVASEELTSGDYYRDYNSG